MKFAIHTLVFYGLDTLPRMLANTGGYVDKIYLSHSRNPWNKYNVEAPNLYESEIDSSLIDGLPFKEKIVWLEGQWTSEEEQRNHSLERAREDGIDVMIIQDVDEFYMPEAFLANLREIRENPNYPAYRCPWAVFWKSLEYVIQVREHDGVKGATVTTCPNFAVNVQMPDVTFVNRRLVNRINEAHMLPGLCLHLAWVLSDDEVMQKIQTWGHSHQFDRLKWYKHKWLAWNQNTTFIGHITRGNYLRAVPYTGQLPKELENFPGKEQHTVDLSIPEKWNSAWLDFASWLRVKLGALKRAV